MVSAFEAGRYLNRLGFHLQQATFFGARHDKAAQDVRHWLEVLLDHLIPDAELDRVQRLVGSRVEKIRRDYSHEGHVDDIEAAVDRLNDTRGDREAECRRVLSPVFRRLAAIRAAITTHLDERQKQAFRLGERVDRLVCPSEVYRYLYEPEDDPAIVLGEYGDIWEARQPLANVSRWPGEIPTEGGLADQVEDLGRTLGCPELWSPRSYTQNGCPSEASLGEIVAEIREALTVQKPGGGPRVLERGANARRAGGDQVPVQDACAEPLSSNPGKPASADCRVSTISGPSPQQSHKAGGLGQRFDFDDTTHTISFDGFSGQIKDPLIYNCFKYIVDAAPEHRRIPLSELPGKVSRSRRLEKHLPPQLFELLDFQKGHGGGVFLKLPRKTPL